MPILYIAALLILFVIFVPCAFQLQIKLEDKKGAATLFWVPVYFLVPWKVKIKNFDISEDNRKSFSFKEFKRSKIYRYAPKIAPIIRVKELEIHLRIGLLNAAALGLLCGGIQIAANAILAVFSTLFKSFPNPPVLWIESDFGKKSFFYDMECIFTFRWGDIILKMIFILKIIWGEKIKNRKEKTVWQASMKSKV